MSNCACVYVDYYDVPEGHVSRMQVARKEWKCEECGRVITPKEKYEYVWGIWDGRQATYRTCLDCVSIREAFFCDGYLYGGIWEAMWEHLRDIRGQVSSDCIVSLTPRARDMLFTNIEEVWENLDDEEEVYGEEIRP